jgi:hypothetical protein
MSPALALGRLAREAAGFTASVRHRLIPGLW